MIMEFKGTNQIVSLGDEKYYNGNKAFEIWYGTDGECIAEVVRKIEDANLIVDAFKVRQQINCELSELKKQRDEMLAMLDKLSKSGLFNVHFPNNTNEIKQLIKKVKDNE